MGEPVNHDETTDETKNTHNDTTNVVNETEGEGDVDVQETLRNNISKLPKIQEVFNKNITANSTFDVAGCAICTGNIPVVPNRKQVKTKFMGQRFKNRGLNCYLNSLLNVCFSHKGFVEELYRPFPLAQELKENLSNHKFDQEQTDSLL